jgi:hypothetical protein
VPVTIQISGVVTDVGGSDAYLYQETIHEDVTFTGIYTYDSATINSSSQSGLGNYIHNSPYGFNISLGGFEFKTAVNHVGQFGISIFNDYSLQTYDRYIVHSEQNVSLSTGLSVNSIGWDLYDNMHTAISSVALPTSAPIIGDWPTNQLFIGCGGLPYGNSTLAIWGTVTQAVIVPEPLTGVLLMTGVFFLRRRR